MSRKPDWPPSHRIVHIELDERTVLRRSAEVEHERSVAIYDLLDDNAFRLKTGGDAVADGPFRLHLAVEDNRLVLDVRDEAGSPLDRVALPLASFRRIVRDYFLICDSYYQAIRTMTPSQIEAIDMGRRGLHNEGSTLLQERLDGRVAMDFPTARRLFTLLCVLHIRG